MSDGATGAGGGGGGAGSGSNPGDAGPGSNKSLGSIVRSALRAIRSNPVLTILGLGGIVVSAARLMGSGSGEAVSSSSSSPSSAEGAGAQAPANSQGPASTTAGGAAAAAHAGRSSGNHNDYEPSTNTNDGERTEVAAAAATTTTPTVAMADDGGDGSLLTATYFRLLGLTLVAMVLCVAFLYALVQHRLVTDFELFTPLIMTGVGITIGGSSSTSTSTGKAKANPRGTEAPSRAGRAGSGGGGGGGGGARAPRELPAAVPALSPSPSPSLPATPAPAEVPGSAAAAAAAAAVAAAANEGGGGGSKDEEDRRLAAQAAARAKATAGGGGGGGGADDATVVGGAAAAAAAAAAVAAEGGGAAADRAAAGTAGPEAEVEPSPSPSPSPFAEVDALVKAKKLDQAAPLLDAFAAESVARQGATDADTLRWRCEVAWRASQLSYLRAAAAPAKAKEAGFAQGVAHAKHAVQLCDHCAAAHKWYAILLSELTGLQGTKVQIASAMEIKEHIDRAMQLDDEDPMPPYMAGAWAFAFSSLGRMSRFFAQRLFGKLPDTDMAQALAYFQESERRKPGWWVKNTLMLGKTHAALKDKAQARKCLQAAADFQLAPADAGDQEHCDEARRLLQKL